MADVVGTDTDKNAALCSAPSTSPMTRSTMKLSRILQSRRSAMTAITDFDADAFLIVAARAFEDLRIGEVFRAPSRTR
ncbi:MAG: hypothetical protein QOE52_5288 [Mycobacterium sp.]|jgi:hypothetical protein|nr:hypothetical protein [Mycobacterium sp.]